MGNDRWIAISVSTDLEWERLTQIMESPEWATDSKYNNRAGRHKNRHDLDERLSAWTIEHDPHTLMNLLQSKGVCASAVYTAEDLLADPHFNDRNFFWTIENQHAPTVGNRQYAGRPFRCIDMPMSIEQVAGLGEHNEQLLSEFCGLSSGQISDLQEQGVIANQPDAEDRVF
jgi:crotonobetainyl-CoA:carnitine CoA-transferase CaiB-like acyl-CoA transferase